MNKKRHFKTSAIFLCILPLLSCIFCSTSSEASGYTENWFNPYLKLSAVQDAPVPETPATTEAPPVVTFDTVVTTSSAITATANDGYNLSSVTVTNLETNSVLVLSNNNNGTYTLAA